MSNLQPNCCLEFDFRKVDRHAGGKWLIHDTKRRKDNQLQSLKLPCRISKLSSKSKQDKVKVTIFFLNCQKFKFLNLSRNFPGHTPAEVDL